MFNKIRKSDSENSDNEKSTSDNASLSSTKSKNPFKKIINKL